MHSGLQLLRLQFRRIVPNGRDPLRVFLRIGLPLFRREEQFLEEKPERKFQGEVEDERVSDGEEQVVYALHELKRKTVGIRYDVQVGFRKKNKVFLFRKL